MAAAGLLSLGLVRQHLVSAVRILFAPYPVYPYASLWLTDYLIAENLRLAYEADNFNTYQPSDDQAGIVLAAIIPRTRSNGDESKTGSAVLTPK